MVGEVYGDPRRADGTVVRTSDIVRHEGHIAITASGSRYELEDDPAEAQIARQRGS